MAVGKITKEAVDAIPVPPPGKRVHLWDETVKGFGVMVTDKGARSYILQYRIGGRGTPTRRVTIGTHGSPWTPAGARKRALELLEQVRRNIDPFDAERASIAAAHKAKENAAAERFIHTRLAFDKIAADYIEKGTWVDGERIRTWSTYERIVERDLSPAFGSKPLPHISSDDIRELLHDISDRAESAARRAHIVLTNIFKYAAKAHPRHFKLSASPMLDVPSPTQSAARDRVLSDEELRLVWLAADGLDWPWRDIIRLLILTGTRLREVAHAPWTEVNLDEMTWLIPAQRAKNNVPHLVPITHGALKIWKSLPVISNDTNLVFPSSVGTPLSAISKMKQNLDQKISDIMTREAIAAGKNPDAVQMQDWRIHDLRRTVASGCQRLGIPLEVSEAVLNHTSGTRSGIAGVYHVYKFESEKRAALEAWGQHVESISRNIKQIKVKIKNES